ncbi:Nudix (Nucleoside diphosphate linked moiety X)-type motif 1, partial [Tilletia horrida]
AAEKEGRVRLLLGLKKRGFGHGRRNGFGGKPLMILHEDRLEAPRECVRRELEEETGLSSEEACDFVFHGTLLIHALAGDDEDEEEDEEKKKKKKTEPASRYATERALLHIFSLPLDAAQLEQAKE